MERCSALALTSMFRLYPSIRPQHIPHTLACELLNLLMLAYVDLIAGLLKTTVEHAAGHCRSYILQGPYDRQTSPHALRADCTIQAPVCLQRAEAKGDQALLCCSAGVGCRCDFFDSGPSL